MSRKRFFITSTGTGIGKTALTCALCWQYRQQQKPVAALKPVISGYDPADAGSDSALILKACGITPSPEAVTAISPWRFRAPLAPSMAARKEGRELDMEALAAFCNDNAKPAQGLTLVEGAGGVLAPVNSRQTMADWMEALGWPVILVTGSYLGTISHTLTAVEALENRGLAVHAIVLSESEESEVPLAETAAELEIFVHAGVPVVKITRQPPQEEPWKAWPPVSWICDA